MIIASTDKSRYTSPRDRERDRDRDRSDRDSRDRGAMPPPHRKMGGSIDVIGSSKKDSRRPANEEVGFSSSLDGNPPTTEYVTYTVSISLLLV